MVELSNKKYDKRVIFHPGEQTKFIIDICRRNNLKLLELADKIVVSKRTLFDWKREKYSMSFRALKIMCMISELKFPDKVDIREPFWSNQKTSILGGKAMYKKYGSIGNPEIRKQKWQEWWNSKGKYNLNKFFITREINLPEKGLELAEFAGIMLGDGGITERQITITLSVVNDKPYSFFVRKLIKNLFKVNPAIYIRKKDSTIRVSVSRKKLVIFCQSIGLKVGNKLKQNLGVPEWIIDNPLYYQACIRGLIDTDGCIFNEGHTIKGKKYSYLRLSLVSASKTLREDVYKMFIEIGYTPVIRNNRSVQLENKKEIDKYFNEIGTNNLHYRQRYENILILLSKN